MFYFLQLHLMSVSAVLPVPCLPSCGDVKVVQEARTESISQAITLMSTAVGAHTGETEEERGKRRRERRGVE